MIRRPNALGLIGPRAGSPTSGEAMVKPAISVWNTKFDVPVLAKRPGGWSPETVMFVVGPGWPGRG